ncbi:BTAD domain-containing putative transcriptional regulator [Micromonospora sp. LOL_015]|uniref:BTAD domain-containing putative transcriptional regulator n=1 Tax=Micromonospora sp. LOL_015 TaxID=3345416 RepID=UPI003A862B00
MQTTPDDRLRVSVLGPVRAWRGGHELHLGPTRQRQVFAALVVAGRAVGRDELVATVWDETPPTTATGNVYTYVSGLRRSLGRDALTLGSAGYALALRRADLDSERFAAACAESARRHSAGDFAAAVAALDEALALWHGEPYEGLTGHRLDLERVRLVRQRLDAIGRRARMLIELRDDRVLAELTGLVRDHPLHEPLHELLVLALHRGGRRAEAIEAYQVARHILRTELGVEPGSALNGLYGQVRRAPAAPMRRNDPVWTRRSHATAASRSASPVAPRSPTWSTPRLAQWGFVEASGAGPQAGFTIGHTQAGSLVGRADELDQLRALFDALADGQGDVLWVEGEPGVGKTALVRAATANLDDRGCQVAWGGIRELDRDAPVQAVARALRPLTTGHLRAARPDGPHLDVADDDNAVDDAPVSSDWVLAQVRTACAVAPVVLVVDDLQSADSVGEPFWNRLVAATRRLPLLLVAVARLEPGGAALARLRRTVGSRRGQVLRLDALPPGVVEQLAVRLVGAPLGPNLAEAISTSAGNPFYAREMTSALLRRGVVQVADGVADIPDSAPIDLPRPLLAVVRSSVDLLSPRAQDVLRTAAMLGTRFSVDDLAEVSGESAVDLVPSLEEAIAANVVVSDDTTLAFRYSALRRVLYGSIPAPARAMLHRHIAEVLGRGAGPATRVAAQLAAVPSAADEWTVSWLVDHCAELAHRAPRLAGELIRRALDTGATDPIHRTPLLIALVRLEFAEDRWPVDEAREAAGLATDPAERAEMRHLLATMVHRRGGMSSAIGIVRKTLSDRTVPEFWRTRHWALLVELRRGGLDDLHQADRRAGAAHAAALAAGRPYDAAAALQTGWLTNSVRRDHERALEFADRALDIMRDNPSFGGLYLDLLDNRAFTLHNLDRLPEAERTLREGRLFAYRHRLPTGLHTASAVLRFWTGRWDDALAEISAVTDDVPRYTLLGMRDPRSAATLLHGLAALIAAHRGDAVLAAGHLDAADALTTGAADRATGGFLLVARGCVAETQGRPDEALRMLSPLLSPDHASLAMRHQWLPELTRLALELDRRDIAEGAAAICADEALREVRPARAHRAAERCRAMITNNPEPALAAASRYGELGLVTEQAASLEDAAVLLAANRRPYEAATTGGAAVRLYTALGARWDLGRVERRLAGYGVEPSPGRAPDGQLDMM